MSSEATATKWSRISELLADIARQCAQLAMEVEPAAAAAPLPAADLAPESAAPAVNADAGLHGSEATLRALFKSVETLSTLLLSAGAKRGPGRPPLRTEHKSKPAAAAAAAGIAAAASNTGELEGAAANTATGRAAAATAAQLPPLERRRDGSNVSRSSRALAALPPPVAGRKRDAPHRGPRKRKTPKDVLHEEGAHDERGSQLAVAAQAGGAELLTGSAPAAKRARSGLNAAIGRAHV